MHSLPVSEEACGLFDLAVDSGPLLNPENCSTELHRLAELSGMAADMRLALVPQAVMGVLEGRRDLDGE